MYSFFFGFLETPFTATNYGFRGFMDCIFFMSLLLCYIPVLPACVLYQSIYLITAVKQKKLQKKTALGIALGFIVTVVSVIVYIIFLKKP